jgi:hypothetical protein
MISFIVPLSKKSEADEMKDRKIQSQSEQSSRFFRQTRFRERFSPTQPNWLSRGKLQQTSQRLGLACFESGRFSARGSLSNVSTAWSTASR